MSTSLWRAVPLYQKDADGRYRAMKELPKPTMPTRVEGCTSGARKKLFKHGIIFPDGYFTPWLGKPHHEFLEFWRAQVREWDQMMAQRKQEGKPDWFCCPRCDEFLSLCERPLGFNPALMEDRWRCDNAACGIEEARVRKKNSVARVEVTRGALTERAWRRSLREASRPMRSPPAKPKAPHRSRRDLADRPQFDPTLRRVVPPEHPLPGILRRHADALRAAACDGEAAEANVRPVAPEHDPANSSENRRLK
jgi:hypothetical protein